MLFELFQPIRSLKAPMVLVFHLTNYDSLHVILGDGQKRLFDALYAVSTHYQDIGYCQGMNYIAAVLILIGNESSAAIKPDEFAFWIMKTFIERHDLRTLWKPGLPG